MPLLETAALLYSLGRGAQQLVASAQAGAKQRQMKDMVEELEANYERIPDKRFRAAQAIKLQIHDLHLMIELGADNKRIMKGAADLGALVESVM
mmetsp:Transcript_34026/g.84871  ORF Transcript_34026/g.84871 Transcript_34026/m.84871 type:complete len:94 (-) Transcript_34026:304-585(-)